MGLIYWPHNSNTPRSHALNSLLLNRLGCIQNVLSRKHSYLAHVASLPPKAFLASSSLLQLFLPKQWASSTTQHLSCPTTPLCLKNGRKERRGERKRGNKEGKKGEGYGIPLCRIPSIFLIFSMRNRLFLTCSSMNTNFTYK